MKNDQNKFWPRSLFSRRLGTVGWKIFFALFIFLCSFYFFWVVFIFLCSFYFLCVLFIFFAYFLFFLCTFYFLGTFYFFCVYLEPEYPKIVFVQFSAVILSSFTTFQSFFKILWEGGCFVPPDYYSSKKPRLDIVKSVAGSPPLSKDIK